MDFTGESLETGNQKLWCLCLKGTDREFPKERIRARDSDLVRGSGGSDPLENMAGYRSMLHFKKFLLQRDLAFVCWCDKQVGS